MNYKVRKDFRAYAKLHYLDYSIRNIVARGLTPSSVDTEGNLGLLDRKG